MQLEEMIYQTIMNYSFEIQKSDLKLQKYGHGPIIVLFGTTSAGKSSIAKKLQAKHHWELFSIDEEVGRLNLFVIAEHFPLEYKLLKSTMIDDKAILSAVFYAKYNFKLYVCDEEKTQVMCLAPKIKQYFLEDNEDFADILEQMYDRIITASKNNQTCILDEVYYKYFVAYLTSQSFHAPMTFVQVYCAWNTWHERISDRNTQAFANKDFLNTRIGLWPVMQFKMLYKTQTNPMEITFGWIGDEDICIALQRRNQEKKQFGMKRRNDNHPVEDIQKEMLGYFQVQKERQVPITSATAYDFYVDTSKNDSDECAKIIDARYKRW